MADEYGPRRPSLEPRGEDRRRGVLLPPQAREALKMGVETMAGTLAVTLGPLGRVVAIDPIVDKGAPELVSQGAIVARRVIEIPDRYVNAGAMLIRHLAWHVRKDVGDGSVTAAVLARAMVRGGARMVAAGANPMVMRRGLERGVRTAICELAAVAQPLGSQESIAALARAVTGDSDLAALIAEVFDIVGVDGTVVVEDYYGLGMDREYVEGVRWDSGLASYDFVTDSARHRALMRKPLIALTTAKLESAAQIVPVLRAALEAEAERLVIIAPEIEGEALGTLLVNHQQGRLSCAPIKAPGSFIDRPEILQDLAVVTGATLIDDKAGLSMEGFRVRHFGRARRVAATRRDFIIIGAGGRPREIRERMAQLRAEMDALDRQEKINTWDRLRRRLANLSGGVAVLKVGAIGKGEAKIRKTVAEDAIESVRCALEEGTVPGGGAAYVACIPALEALAAVTEEIDEAAGVRIVAEALTAPLQQIADNAGYPGSTIAAKVKMQGRECVFDALSGQIVPATEGGILDPARVVRVALEKAASIAAMILTTDAIVLTERMGGLEKRDGRGALRGVDLEP
jgi:chaperonin GroEL